MLKFALDAHPAPSQSLFPAGRLTMAGLKILVHGFVKADIKEAALPDGRGPQAAGPAQGLLENLGPVLPGRLKFQYFFPFADIDFFGIR